MIAADTVASAGPEGWPVHPRDGTREVRPVGLYIGAAGVVWGLGWLARRGAELDEALREPPSWCGRRARW